MPSSPWLRRFKPSAPAARARAPKSHRKAASFPAPPEPLEDRRLLSSVVVQTNLVSDDTSVTPALVEDENLVNPWGLAASPTGAWWVANEGTGTSTLYDTSSSPPAVVPLVVDIPANPDGGLFPIPNSPTGIVYNIGGSGTFELTPDDPATSSVFLFNTVDGTISGWAPGTTDAVVKVHSDSAVYQRRLPRPGHRQ